MKSVLQKVAKKYFNADLQDCHLSDYHRIDGLDIDLSEVLMKTKLMYEWMLAPLLWESTRLNLYLYGLQNKGYDIVFSTARGIWGQKSEVEALTKLQLSKHGITNYNKLIIADVGTKLYGLENVALFVDDHYNNLEPYKNTLTKLLLVDKPWNRSVDEEGLVRIPDISYSHRFLN